MFEFFKKQVAKPVESLHISPDAIAAPQAFVPIDVVTPDQSIPGKFDYHSSTWKFLHHYLEDRMRILRFKNDNVNLTIERTQVLRGQLKEIKTLINYTNQLAGIPLPKKTSLSQSLTDKGTSYE